MTKDTALRIALEAFNKLAAWNDGEVGCHMDEPYSAEVAREAITAIKAALEAKDEHWEKFCDSNCVWTDHHPDCKLAKDEPVCKDCNGTGSADSGGTHPWGEPIFIRCHCTYPTPPQQKAKDEPWEQFYPEMGKPYALEASMYSNDRMKVDPVTGNVSIGTPQQEAKDEPVAWCVTYNGELTGNIFENRRIADLCKRNLEAKYGSEESREVVPIYTNPPQRTWIGLTNDEIVLIVAECAASHQHTDIHFARAIEAKLKEKNK